METLTQGWWMCHGGVLLFQLLPLPPHWKWVKGQGGGCGAGPWMLALLMPQQQRKKGMLLLQLLLLPPLPYKGGRILWW